MDAVFEGISPLLPESNKAGFSTRAVNCFKLKQLTALVFVLVNGATNNYLWLMSYGMPSALGALDFFEVNARTTIVAR